MQGQGLNGAAPRHLVVAALLAAGWAVGDSAPLRAQTAPAAGAAQQPLPTVVVEGRRKQAPRRSRARAQRAAPAPAAAAPQAPSAPAETGTGPVQGYIASQSVTGLKTDTPLRETPQSISVVSAEQASDQGATTVQEAFRYVPGVHADAYGPDSRGDFPRIRGQDPNIYLDGMRINNTFQFNEWRPDPYMLSRFEILRGPPSMLYGDSSIAGIVNLVTKRPQLETFREVAVQYGTFDRKQVQTDWTGKITDDGKWLYRFVGVFRDSDYQTDYVKDDRALFAPSVTWRPTEDTNWTLMGVYQHDKSGSSTAFLPHSGTIWPNPNGQIPINRFVSEPGFDLYQTKVASITSLFEHRVGDWLRLQQNTRYVHLEGKYYTGYPNLYFNLNPQPQDDPFPYLDASKRTVTRIFFGAETRKNIFTTDNNAEIKFGTGPIAHRMLVGLDYRRTDEQRSEGMGLDLRPFDLYDPVYLGALPFNALFNPLGPSVLTDLPKTAQSQTGLYVQDQLRWGSLIGVFGVRHDWATSETAGSPTERHQATTGRAALMYELPFGVSPYVSYATSFNPIIGTTCVGGGTCKPQEGEQVEAGVKYSPMRGLVVNAAIFQAEESNRLATDPGGSLLSAQIGKVRIRGGEIEVLASLTSDLDVVAGYSYTDARVIAGDNAGNHVEAVPVHQASLWGKYRLVSLGLPNFTIGAGVRYIGESYDGTDNPLLTTPSYTLFDAMLRYENGPWRFQVNATNIGDKIYFATCLARGDCFYGNRRTILSTLTYRF